MYKHQTAVFPINIFYKIMGFLGIVDDSKTLYFTIQNYPHYVNFINFLFYFEKKSFWKPVLCLLISEMRV